MSSRKSGQNAEARNEEVRYDIYAIMRITEDPTDLRAYVGLAKHFKRRTYEHKKRFKLGEVYKMESIFNKIMTRDEAEVYEGKYIYEFINKGYKLFNEHGISHKNRCYTYTDKTLNPAKLKEKKQKKYTENMV